MMSLMQIMFWFEQQTKQTKLKHQKSISPHSNGVPSITLRSLQDKKEAVAQNTKLLRPHCISKLKLFTDLLIIYSPLTQNAREKVSLNLNTCNLFFTSITFHALDGVETAISSCKKASMKYRNRFTLVFVGGFYFK